MKWRPSRPVLLASALLLICAEIGGVTAYALRPAANPRASAPVGLASPFGALLQNLRGRRVEIARLDPPALPGDPAPALARPPAFFFGYPPLPPATEPGPAAAELFAPPGGAPFPPARPRDLVDMPAATAVALAAPTGGEEAAPRRDGGDFRMGAAAYVRIFKKEGELELWLKRDGRYSLYRAYPVCKWSGRLGPKLRSGDYQSPEGFYSVSTRQLNPSSAYHRAFDIGFPNAFDRQNGRTGAALMVHGACKSVGCFAMTDKIIEEIYAFVEAALRGGQKEVPVHIFPFRMTEAVLAKETLGDWTTFWSAPEENRRWSAFWRNLKEGYDLFEQTGEPPTAYACGDRYAFGAEGGACKKIAGW